VQPKHLHQQQYCPMSSASIVLLNTFFHHIVDDIENAENAVLEKLMHKQDYVLYLQNSTI
jgi:hypothetical protein